jgi:hypothetical protein
MRTKPNLEGVNGIIRGLLEFMRDPSVLGYIHYAIIQPQLINTNEAKVVCFNGKAQFINIIKRGKGRSPFAAHTKAGRQRLFQFAEQVIASLRVSCPHLNSQQLIRVDVMGFPDDPPGTEFIVNEVESYESMLTSKGIAAGDHIMKIKSLVEEHYFEQLIELIEYYLAHN